MIALLLKPLFAFGLYKFVGYVHGFVYRVLPDGKFKTFLLRER